ncbi:MAG: hypothetical protein AAGC88_16635, partial [Bacteroidota bacterium]
WNISNAGQELTESGNKLRYMSAAMKQTPKVATEHFETYNALSKRFYDLRFELYGDPNRGALNESRLPGIWGRVRSVAGGHWGTTQLPTTTFKENLEKAANDFEGFSTSMSNYLKEVDAFEEVLISLGAPSMKGRR